MFALTVSARARLPYLRRSSVRMGWLGGYRSGGTAESTTIKGKLARVDGSPFCHPTHCSSPGLDIRCSLSSVENPYDGADADPSAIEIGHAGMVGTDHTL